MLLANAKYCKKPLVISRTPVRISFFGGGTDYPAYYRENSGAVLGTTIDQYIHITVNEIGHFQDHILDHKFRLVYSKTELVKSIDQIQHPSIRECLKHLQINRFMDIHTISDLPARTGLGSSSAFTVGLLHALYSFLKKDITKQKLAETACLVEQKLIREKVGSQDQFHAAFGGFNLIKFYGNDIKVEKLAILPSKMLDLEEHFMVFYTGLTRYAEEILEEQIGRTKNRSNDTILQEMYNLVFEAKNLLISANSSNFVRDLGYLLHESWLLKKQLSSRVSNSLIDKAYKQAINAGAYGGKLCGAGSGGFLVLLVPPEEQARVRQSVSYFSQVPVRLENNGSTIIYQDQSY